MKKRKILFISAFLLGIVTMSGAIFGPVSAEKNDTKPAVWLQVSPTSRSLSLEPGDTYDGEFTVSNIGSESFSFKVYASPFSVVGENYDHDYSSEKNYNQIHRWVTFDKTEFSLAVDESQVIIYHVNVPEDVPTGSQHAVLFAESSGNNTSSNGIKAISRVGMRLIARVSGETNEGVEITDYSLPTLRISFNASQITATSKVKNTGNADAEARYNFEVKPFFGGDPVFSEEKTSLIYPDSEYRHNIAWENTPLLGLFSVTYSVSINKLTQDETRVVLVIPAWLLIILLILLTFLVIWIILKVKKRRKLRSKMQL
ncbi:hypothetical protein FWF89_01315 [Candidatus Saccharibacteria bacterium]|nr:hypothetical protein [Candidatus Saccharibacteria bacterium]